MGPDISTGLTKQFKLLWRSPKELRTLYLVNFLNSYKYFSMALVLPLIATAEYGFTDTQAGGLYGMWGILITVWGFIASWTVDRFGVRTTAIFSCAASVAARAVFAFCRSPQSLVVAVLVLSPIGDGTFDPCFNVGLKKTTTDLTRPFAYALAYTVMNLGGAFSDTLTDYIRLREFEFFGVPFSGLRCVLLSALVLMVVAFGLCLTLRDLSEVEAAQEAKAVLMTPPTKRHLTTPQMNTLVLRGGPRGGVSPSSASEYASFRRSHPSPQPLPAASACGGQRSASGESRGWFGSWFGRGGGSSSGGGSSGGGGGSRGGAGSGGGGSDVRLSVARGKKAFESPRWVPNFSLSFSSGNASSSVSRKSASSERQPLTGGGGGGGGGRAGEGQQQQQQRTTALWPNAPTQHGNDGKGAADESLAGGDNHEDGSGGGDGGSGDSPTSLFSDPNFWRVVVFMSLTLFTSQQWRFIDLIMPKFCTRFFGDAAPFANIQSINFWGCVFAPPLISSWTSGLDDLAVMLPGLWVFSLAPLPLVFSNSLGAVSAWIAIMTLGEVIWSPRSSSYAASMAPKGREGMFLMMCSWPVYLTKYPAGLFSGWLLSHFSPDCPTCKDDFDLFCPIDPSPYYTSFAPPSADTSFQSYPSSGSASESPLYCVSGSGGDYGGACADALVGPSSPSGAQAMHCAQTCQECPGWKGDGETLFLWIFALAMVSPIVTSLLFTCLQRPYDTDDWNDGVGGDDAGKAQPPLPLTAQAAAAAAPLLVIPPFSGQHPRYEKTRVQETAPGGAGNVDDDAELGWRQNYGSHATAGRLGPSLPVKANSLNDLSSLAEE